MTQHQIEELMERQERLNLALDAGNLCSWEIDLETHRLIHSPNATELLGFTVPEDLDAIVALVHPDDRERVAAAGDETILNGAPYSCEYRIVNPDTGEARWYQSQGGVKTSRSGKNIFVGITRAIAEAADTTSLRHDAIPGEKRIPVSPSAIPSALTLEKYQALFGTIDEGFCVLEKVSFQDDEQADLRILDANPAFGRLSGTANVSGKTIRELFPAEAVEWIECYNKVFASGEAVKCESDQLIAGRQVASYAYRIQHNPRPQVAVLFFDITPRKAREKDEEFIAALSDQVTRMQDAEEIMQVAGARLGWHGRFSRCLFIEVQAGGESVWVNRHWQQHGIPVLQGYFSTETFIETKDIEAAKTKGWLLAGSSAQADTSLSKLLTDYGIDSALMIPFFRKQELTFLLFLTEQHPRNWSAQETLLACTIAGRLWTGIERCRFEKALRESEIRLQKALSIETVGVMFLNERGKIVQANDAFCQLSGYNHAELSSGRIGWEKITPPEWLERGREGKAELDKTGRLTPYEKEYFRKDGTKFWVLVAASLINEKETVVYVVDVSDWRQTTEALVKAESEQRHLAARLNLALDAGRLGSYDYHLSNGAIYCSAQCKQNFGLGEREFLNFEKLVSLILPEYREGMQEAVRNALEQDHEYHADYQIRKPDGTITWIRASGKPIRENGIPVRVVGITQDILEEKDFATALGRQVAERTLELKRSNEDLLQFAHVASHDLKEPVRKVRVFTSMLKEELGAGITPSATAFIDKIQKAGDRMISMIEGVLNYSMHSANTDLFVPVDLNETLKQIVQDLELPLQQTKGTIRCEPLPVIEGTEVLIYQLFYNLIYNAVKFSKKGVPPEISVSSSLEQDGAREWALIRIGDNGIGLDNGFAEKIFESFVRLNSKAEYEGTGLGLALCRKIVARHKGTISAAGEMGRGSVFSVRLPVRQG